MCGHWPVGSHKHVPQDGLGSCLFRVGVGSLLSAESGDDVDEATVVLNATSRPSRLLLLLLLLFHLGRLTLDFAGASQGAVDFASEESSVHLQRAQLPAGGKEFR